jgi:Di-haem cytochrome c peroxidase
MKVGKRMNLTNKGGAANISEIACETSPDREQAVVCGSFKKEVENDSQETFDSGNYGFALLLVGHCRSRLSAKHGLSRGTREVNLFRPESQNLSINNNQACAACHSPDTGFTGPQSGTNGHGAVYQGAIASRFGNRRPPSVAYVTPSPVLHFVTENREALFIGGNFWDGRATGEQLGNPAADQALGPFLNPLEQGLPDKACVVYRVCTAAYRVSFEAVWGSASCLLACRHRRNVPH